MGTKKTIALVIPVLLSIIITFYLIFANNKTEPTIKESKGINKLVNTLNTDDHVIMPLPLDTPEETAEVLLGKLLFHDRSLSNNGLSCESCHALSRAGINLNDKWTINGSQKYNTLDIYNTKYYAQLFWTGKTTSRQKQLEINFLNGMGITPEEVLQKVRAIKSYVKAYEEVYPEGLTQENLFHPIIAYQNALQSPSKFDRYLHGDSTAISETAKEGFLLFKRYGCASCHQGISIGGNMRQKLGVFDDFFRNRERRQGIPYKRIDDGRRNITNEDHDKNMFRVPSLRNVAITGPYLHDGSIEDLEDVIKIMGKYQLGRAIPAADLEKIKAFLFTLTGECFLEN